MYLAKSAECIWNVSATVNTSVFGDVQIHSHGRPLTYEMGQEMGQGHEYGKEISRRWDGVTNKDSRK